MMFLDGYKTYIAAGIGIIIGLAELAGIDVVPGVDASNALNFIYQAILGVTIRHGIAKA